MKSKPTQETQSQQQDNNQFPEEVLNLIREILEAVRSKQQPEEKPETFITAIGANSLVDLCSQANTLEIKKSDIIDIIPAEGQFYMVYEAER